MAYENIHYANLTGDDQLIQLLFLSWSALAKSSSLKQYENLTAASDAVHACYIRKFCWSDHWRYDCILSDFLLILSHVNFLSSFWFWMTLYSCDFAFNATSHSCNFSIVEKTPYWCRHVVFWQRYSVVLLLKPPRDFVIRIFHYALVEIIVRSAVDNAIRILTLDARQWKQSDRNCCSRIVSHDVKYRESVLHRCSGKLRRFFQSCWHSWSVITAMDSRKTWNDWRLSLKMSMRSNDWNYLL